MLFEVKFHKSLCHEYGINEEYKSEVKENNTIIEAIKLTLKSTKAYNLLFDENNKLKTGFLIISKGTELISTKQLSKKISEYSSVKIIPIYHGG